MKKVDLLTKQKDKSPRYLLMHGLPVQQRSACLPVLLVTSKKIKISRKYEKKKYRENGGSGVVDDTAEDKRRGKGER